MDATLKKTLTNALKMVIKHIEQGKCDNMTTEQYNKLIECLEMIVEVECTKTKRSWFGILF